MKLENVSNLIPTGVFVNIEQNDKNEGLWILL